MILHHLEQVGKVAAVIAAVLGAPALIWAGYRRLSEIPGGVAVQRVIRGVWLTVWWLPRLVWRGVFVAAASDLVRPVSRAARAWAVAAVSASNGGLSLADRQYRIEAKLDRHIADTAEWRSEVSAWQAEVAAALGRGAARMTALEDAATDPAPPPSRA